MTSTSAKTAPPKIRRVLRLRDSLLASCGRIFSLRAGRRCDEIPPQARLCRSLIKIKNKLSKNKINNIYNNYENKNNKNKNIIKIKKHKNKKIIINSISKNTSAQTIIILKNNSNKNPEINNIKNEDKIKIIEIN